MTCVVLFSDDFRIKDNLAFFNACRDFNNIIPVFIYDENYLGRNLGAATKVFLNNVLQSFDNLLKEKYNIGLIIKKGKKIDILKEIYKEEKFEAIYFNHSYSKAEIECEKKIFQEFSNQNINVKSFKSKILFEPKDIFTLKGDSFKVFTPFSKECLRKFKLIGDFAEEPDENNILKDKKILSNHNIKTLRIEDLNLLPNHEGEWHEKLLSYWTFDYKKIEDNFLDFLNNKLEKYKENRNTPSVDGNSKLSPYFRFGMISIRYCFNTASKFEHLRENQFILELLWREFTYHTMYHNQNIASEEIRHGYKNFKWDNDEVFLEKWQKGETGYDIVDAGMIELYQTGFMHNRLRMIVASFLIKDLLIDWRKGDNWFWETLIDADIAVNSFSWQWVFGSGLDGAPYFRIFNPFLQKERFDPEGFYCKKWLPKFYQLKPIVDHDIRKKITMERYKKCFEDESCENVKNEELF